MATFKYLLWLSLKEISHVMKFKLLTHFGDVRSVYMADIKTLSECDFLNEKQKKELCDKDLTSCDIVLERCERANINVVSFYDSTYPDMLKNIYDPPLIIYTKGKNINLQDKLLISMVGTRKASPYGIQVAEKLSYELAKNGAIIVSGMAEGIDRHAHLGALKAGGQTIAVLGCGVDICYPSSNKILMDDIAALGLLISEYPPGTHVDSKNFPIRNRLISGMSYGVIVAEAPLKSGALITARYGVEQGREVFAIPGNIDSNNSKGCNKLIYDGATLVTNAQEVLCEFEWLTRPLVYKAPDYKIDYSQEHKKSENSKEEHTKSKSAEPPKGEELPNKEDKTKVYNKTGLTQEQILMCDAILSGCGTNDEIISKTAIPASNVMANITILEVNGIICRKAGRLTLK